MGIGSEQYVHEAAEFEGGGIFEIGTRRQVRMNLTIIYMNLRLKFIII